MGSGKSTVGVLAARHAGAAFVDLDERIVAAAGVSIPEIFATEGEAGFRRRETEALLGAAEGRAVVACGGGVVLVTANVDLMRARGPVVWLDAPPEVLAARIGAGEGRPLVEGAEAGVRLRAIAAAREAAYAAAAHHRLDVARHTPEKIAEEVVRLWSAWR